MLEIVLLFAVFCAGVVGVGVLSTGDIYKQITNKVNEMSSGNREARGVSVRESSVDTAAINTETGDMLVNTKDIKEEILSTTQAVYDSIRDKYKLLGEVGLDKAQTYKEFMTKIKDSVVDSTATHEIGHVWSKADEVGAELYRSAVNGYGELTAKDKLDYAVSFYNLIKKGGDEGYKTAQETYNVLKNKYEYLAEPIKDIVNAMLNSDSKVVYGKKSAHLDV